MFLLSLCCLFRPPRECFLFLVHRVGLCILTNSWQILYLSNVLRFTQHHCLRQYASPTDKDGRRLTTLYAPGVNLKSLFDVLLYIRVRLSGADQIYVVCCCVCCGMSSPQAPIILQLTAASDNHWSLPQWQCREAASLINATCSSCYLCSVCMAIIVLCALKRIITFFVIRPCANAKLAWFRGDARDLGHIGLVRREDDNC